VFVGGVEMRAEFSATTALGITETMRGSREARRTVFSLLDGLVSPSFHFAKVTYHVWLTHIT